MTGPRRAGLAASVVLGALLLTGCAENKMEIITWTDEHGRACTGVVIKDGDDSGREVTSIDCDYPPDGVRPGRSTTIPLAD
ncbi:hypothetical protein AB0L56_14650 [Streptomyces sp. NPDC052079]|uniref:hypothetical protein n=1 Tax=unclassified Streptomyces TaxID=2593676 RepID=UPI0033FCCFA7